MDIEDYLNSTRLIHKTPARTEPDWFVDYLLSSTKHFFQGEIGFRQISSSAASHQAVKLGSKWFIVWDNVLAQTCSDLLYGFGNYHLANQVPDRRHAASARAFGSGVCRRTFAAYFANKLVDRPYVSAALAMLACDKVEGEDSLTEAGLTFVSKLGKLQKMIMFFHEFAHVMFDAKPELHTRCMTAVMGLLNEIGKMQMAGEIYTDDAPTYLRNSRELDPNSPANIKRHFSEELACDYQAFYLACLEDSNGEGRMLDWKDALGMCVLASQLLGTLEGNLNIGLRALVNICQDTENLSRLENFDPAGIQARMKEETPRFLIRRWNTLLALQRVLKDAGPHLGIDAHQYQEHILECFSAANNTWNETVTKDFSFFFMPEGLAKIHARVRYLKNDRSMSEEQALEYTANALRWGCV
jgi:hypothetical protein